MYVIRKKKETEQKVRSTKASLKDVNITETVEGAVRADQHGREKNEKAVRMTTKTNLRDVNMAVETVELGVRKEQHERDKDWKNTGRQQKQSNTKYVPCILVLQLCLPNLFAFFSLSVCVCVCRVTLIAE